MKAPTTALTFALATLFGLATAYAQQQPQASPQQRSGQQPGQQSAQPLGHATGQAAEVPEMLKSLNLKEEQKQQIKQICSKHDQELTQLQQQFQKLHNKSVMLEAAWATALESQMDEGQKQKFRQSREKAHQDQQREKGRSEVYFRGEPKEQTGTQQQGSQPEARQQGEQPRSGQPIQQRNLQNNQQRDQARPGTQSSAQSGQQSQPGSQQTARTGQETGQIMIITITSPRQYYTAAGLSDEQERKCEQMCEAFHEEIGSVWRQLRSVHQEMVTLEAEKMSEIEKVLTDEQRQQLKRQHEQFQTSTQSQSGEDSDQIRLQPRGQNRTFKDKDTNNSTNNNNDN